MPELGRVYTPPSLAAALVRHTISRDTPRDASRMTVCDPACGDGALLAAVAAQFPQARLFGFDLDKDAVAAARARLPQANIICDDALARRWKQTFDFVVANPPWVSFSGRHAHRLTAGRRAVLRRFDTFAGWPTLHGPFVELSLRLATHRCGLLLPDQICEIDGYRPLRAHIRRRAEVLTPVLRFGEDAFPGVTQVTCGLVLQVRAAPSDEGRAQNQAGWGRPFQSRVLLPRALTERKRPDPAMFVDIGVHSGNCARKLFDRGGYLVREGKDLAPYVARAARRTFAPLTDMAPGEYFRAKDLATYQAIPILLRQTAPRPIAALHKNPTFYRNSVLGCRGVAGVAPELVVAWLNSTAVAWYHRTRVAESGQRAFPQIKLRHLRDLPMPDWSVPPPTLAAAARAVGDDTAHESAVDRLVWQWFGLPEPLWDSTRQAVGTGGSQPVKTATN